VELSSGYNLILLKPLIQICPIVENPATLSVSWPCAISAHSAPSGKITIGLICTTSWS
jgi:hypothetical protein